MKTRLLFLLAWPLIILSFGCSDKSNDTFEYTGTYIGLMNFSDSTFQQTTYTITVTQAGGSSVLITPSTADATQWTVSVLNDDGVYTCVNCSVNQVTFQWVNGAVQLDYTYQGNEQFFGSKQ